jgi:26S proteasome regulatory subunit N1
LIFLIRVLKKQLAFMLARQKIYLECDDEEVQHCLTNAKLSEHFLALARELDVMAPKTPEDIYKTHLENSRKSNVCFLKKYC